MKHSLCIPTCPIHSVFLVLAQLLQQLMRTCQGRDVLRWSQDPPGPPSDAQPRVADRSQNHIISAAHKHCQGTFCKVMVASHALAEQRCPQGNSGDTSALQQAPPQSVGQKTHVLLAASIWTSSSLTGKLRHLTCFQIRLRTTRLLARPMRMSPLVKRCRPWVAAGRLGGASGRAA